ncbi:hypothetical protein QJQ45_003756 [Haematococcus lacustris]|nr:hypothetical protein QJQ45_003756 [Haematococcus lacustris]
MRHRHQAAPQQAPWPHRVKRQHCRGLADEADVPPAISQDWRSFRAALVAGSRQARGGEQSESNQTLLHLQDPVLGREAVWAHSIPDAEQGGLLLATRQAPEVLMNDGLEQAVVFLASHGPEGSLGLLLNKPTSLMLGRKPGGLRFDVANAPPQLQQVFSDARVYCGGWTAQQVVHLMHPHPLPKAVQVVPGIFLGGEATAAEEVAAGRLAADSFKFFSGFPAACARALVLKPTLQLPTPLWREVLLLMGGAFKRVAEAAYEGDEVSGE